MRIGVKNTKVRSGILEVRDIAQHHIEEIKRVQGSVEPWIPAIADAVGVALLDVVEDCDERLGMMDAEQISVSSRYVVALAFNFLVENTAGVDEFLF